MARGWESKSVEAQMESAEDKPAAAHGAMTPEQIVRHRQRESLQLARARVVQQLEIAREPRYIKLLNDALEDLNARLSRMK
ncbi:MAG: hypothetical protein LAN37_10150 [Acidobacteriia bacterium]|jgi:hypothetical protein|nr:hypothetical protein [Terriglobia bacterium]